MTKLAPALLASLALAAAACAGGGPERATVLIETPAGEVRLDVELAETPEQRRLGLMGRESVPERLGMLFLYDEPTRGGFWMKGTLIPLSIAFLDADGRILLILDLEPCRAEPCPVYRPGVAYSSALEVSRGAFERLGVGVGDVVRRDSAAVGAWAVAALAWAASLPVALVWTRRQGFLAGGDPIILFRVPIVAFLAPAVVLAAAVAALLALAARRGSRRGSRGAPAP